MMAAQLKPPAMPWKPEDDITSECANEIWSGIESVEPFCARQQSPCSALKASVVFATLGAISSVLQPKIQNGLERLSAYWNLRHDMREPPDLSAARSPHWLGHTRCGRPRFRETSVTGRFFWRDAVTSDSLARWWHTVSARLAECAAVRKSSHIGVQLHLHNIFKILKKLHIPMPHATPNEMTLAEHPDPDLEVSLIQRRERFKRSLARVDLLDVYEISWLGAVARVQARTSAAMVRREQHKRFHEWFLSASSPPCSSWNRYWQTPQTCQQSQRRPIALPSFH